MKEGRWEGGLWSWGMVERRRCAADLVMPCFGVVQQRSGFHGQCGVGFVWGLGLSAPFELARFEREKCGVK